MNRAHKYSQTLRLSLSSLLRAHNVTANVPALENVARFAPYPLDTVAFPFEFPSPLTVHKGRDVGFDITIGTRPVGGVGGKGSGAFTF